MHRGTCRGNEFLYESLAIIALETLVTSRGTSDVQLRFYRGSSSALVVSREFCPEVGERRNTRSIEIKKSKQKSQTFDERVSDIENQRYRINVPANDRVTTVRSHLLLFARRRRVRGLNDDLTNVIAPSEIYEPADVNWVPFVTRSTGKYDEKKRRRRWS